MSGEDNNNLYNLYGNNGSFFQNLKDYNYNSQTIQGVGKEIDKERINELNENYLEKRYNYKKILIAVLIACLLYFILICISRFTSFLSQTVVDILFIIIFLITTIYCFKILYDIYRRNNIYFGRLNANPPPQTTSANSIAGKQDTNNLLGTSLGKCVGQDCCISGESYWDPGTMKCIPKKTNGIASDNGVNSLGNGKYLYRPSDKLFYSTSQIPTPDVRCGYSIVEPGTPCYLSKEQSDSLPAIN